MTKWQCLNCTTTMKSPYRPGDKAMGKCPSTPSGKHVWVKCDE